MRELSAVELKEHLDNAAEAPYLLDVREQREFDICRLENAQLTPMNQVPTLLSVLEKEQEIVVICHHGIRSRMVGRFLEQNGYSNVINLSGGVDQWAKTVDPTMRLY